jgi:hypothetical protein
MLMRICRVLGTSPNVVLGFEEDGDEPAPGDARKRLSDRLAAAARGLDDRDLEVLVRQAEAFADTAKRQNDKR